MTLRHHVNPGLPPPREPSVGELPDGVGHEAELPLLLIALGVQSLSRWKRGKGAVAQTLASLVVSAALAFVMGKKWLTGGSFVPSGIVFVGGVCMCLFYAQNIATGGNPPRESKED